MPAIDAAHKPETSKRQDKRRTSLTLRVNVRFQIGSVSSYDVHRRQKTRNLTPQCSPTDALACR